MQKEVIKKVKDIKVTAGEQCFSQHKLLIIDLMMEHRAVRQLRKPRNVEIEKRKNEKDDERCKRGTGKLRGLEQVCHECSRKSLRKIERWSQ